MEYLPNIQQLIIYFQIDISNVAESTSLFFGKSSKQLYSLSSTNEPTDALLISFPGLVSVSISLDFASLPSFPQVSRIDNVLVVQFRGAKMLATVPNTPTYLLSWKDFSHCTKITCAACEYPLIPDPCKFFFKDLPNEHWLELLDCWSCHDNEFAPIAQRALSNETCPAYEHEHDHKHGHSYHYSLNNSGHGHILPPSGKIYLGLDHLLVNTADGLSSNCPSCKTVIGESFFNEHVKLFRHSVLIQLNEPRQTIHETLNRVVMHRILDTIDNHSTFQFILKASGLPRVFIRVLNWKLAKLVGGCAWKPAFKIGFAPAFDHTDVETIVINPRDYNQIMQQFNSSHKSDLFESKMKFPDLHNLKLAYIIDE